MGMLEQLKAHLASITPEEFRKEWEEIEAMCFGGPTVDEFIKNQRMNTPPKSYMYDMFIPAAVAKKYQRESLIGLIRLAYLASDLGEVGFDKQHAWIIADWQTEAVTELLFEISEKINELEEKYLLDYEFSRRELELNSWIISRLED